MADLPLCVCLLFFFFFCVTHEGEEQAAAGSGGCVGQNGAGAVSWAEVSKTRRENSKKGKQGDSSPPRTLHHYSQLHPQLSSFSVLPNLKVEAEMLTRWRKTQLLDIPPRLSRLSSVAAGEKCHRPIRRWRPCAGAPVKEREDKWCFRDLRILQQYRECLQRTAAVFTFQ